MKTYALAYLATAVVFLGLDFLWLSVMGPALYRPVLGESVLEKFNLIPALFFYVIYVAGIVVFAVSPALDNGRWTTALLYGALLGFFCYATYDLTNQATLKQWSTLLTVVDMAWGTLVTAAAATVASLLINAFAKG